MYLKYSISIDFSRLFWISVFCNQPQPDRFQLKNDKAFSVFGKLEYLMMRLYCISNEHLLTTEQTQLNVHMQFLALL